jgi:hypothetical protein
MKFRQRGRAIHDAFPRPKQPTLSPQVHAAVGCSVTLKCSTSRRRCSRTMNTNSTLMVTVGGKRAGAGTSETGALAPEWVVIDSVWRVGNHRLRSDRAQHPSNTSGWTVAVQQSGTPVRSRAPHDWKGPPPCTTFALTGRSLESESNMVVHGCFLTECEGSSEDHPNHPDG